MLRLVFRDLPDDHVSKVCHERHFSPEQTEWLCRRGFSRRLTTRSTYKNVDDKYPVLMFTKYGKRYFEKYMTTQKYTDPEACYMYNMSGGFNDVFESLLESPLYTYKYIRYKYQKRDPDVEHILARHEGVYLLYSLWFLGLEDLTEQQKRKYINYSHELLTEYESWKQEKWLNTRWGRFMKNARIVTVYTLICAGSVLLCALIASIVVIPVGIVALVKIFA